MTMTRTFLSRRLPSLPLLLAVFALLAVLSLGDAPPAQAQSDPLPAVSFQSFVNEVNEADGKATLGLLSNPAPASDISVTVNSVVKSGTTATAGEDYTGTTWQVDIPAGTNFKEFTIPIAWDDELGDDGEVFDLEIAPGTGYTTEYPSSAIVTIYEDLWSATLNVKEIQATYFGCDNTETGKECSTTSVLSDDDFSYGGATYTVQHIYDSSLSNGFFLKFDRDVTTALDLLTLYVDGTPFDLAATTHPTGDTWAEWVSRDAGWAAGDTVKLSLKRTALWATTLTPKSVESNAALGCRNAETTAADKCSATATLGDDDFDLGGTTYSVVHVTVVNSSKDLVVYLDQAIPDALRDYTLHVGDNKFALADASTAGTTAGVVWSGSGLTWTADADVALSLKPSVAPGAPTHPGASSRDGGLNAFWVPPSDTGDSDISGYDVQYKQSGAPDKGAVLWSAKLTAQDLESSSIFTVGCSHQAALAFFPEHGCSTVATLTDDGFDLDGTAYTVAEVMVSTSAAGEGAGVLYLALTTNIPDALQTYTLLVGDAQFPLASATISGAGTRRYWSNTGLNWADGDEVELALLATDPSTGWVDTGYEGTNPRAAIGAPVWKATLNARDASPTTRGCEAGASGADCSTASVLSDDDFVYGGVTYTVETVSQSRTGAGFHIEFNTNVETVLDRLTLYVDGTPLALAAAVHSPNNTWAQWESHDPGWAVGDTVELELRSTPALTNYEDYDVRVRAVTSVGASPWTETVTGKPARQKTVWSATLTSKEIATSQRYGCGGSGANACATALTDATFTAEGSDYTINHVVMTVEGFEPTSSKNHLSFFTNLVPNSLVEGYTLVVADVEFSLAEATISRDGLAWQFVNFPWFDWSTPGSTVELSMQKELLSPGAPTNLGLEAGDGSLSASWTAPAEQGASPVSGYEIEYRETPAAGQTNTVWQSLAHSGAGVTAQIAGLTNLEVYDARVRAVNTVGAGEWSNVATETPLPDGTIWAAKLTVGDRTGLGARIGCESTQDTACSIRSVLTDHTFTFADVAYSITSVRLIIGQALDFELGQDFPEELKTYSLVVDDVDFSLSAADGAIFAAAPELARWTDSLPTWTVGQVVQLQLRPGTIATGLALAPAQGKLTATWRAPFSEADTVTRYDLHYKERAAPDQAAATAGDPSTGWVDAGHTDTALSRELTGLTDYTGYQARVRAVRAAEPGDWSAVAMGRPLPPGEVWVWDADLTVGDVTFGAGCGTPQTPTTTERGCGGALSDTTIDYRGETYTVEYVNLRSVWPYTDASGGSILRIALDRPFARGGGGFLTLLVNGTPFTWEDGDDHGCHHSCSGGAYSSAGAVKSWYETGLSWAADDTVELGLVYRKTVWFGSYEDSTIPFDEVMRETPYFEQLPGFPDSSIRGIWVRLSEPAPAGGLTLSVSVDPAGTATEGVDFELLSPTVTLAAGAVYGGSDAEDIRLRIIDDEHEDSGETIILNVTASHDFITRDIRITILNHDAPLPEGAVEYVPPPGRSYQQATGQPAPEPADVQVTPGDGALTVSWTVSPPEGVSGDSIRHALRWSQEPGVWANPQDPKGVGKNDGVTVNGGETSYTITGLENGVATGVFVRSFTGDDHTEGSPHSSRWVEVKGEETTPRAAEAPAPVPGASDDATLGELSLPYWGSLEPAFDPATTEYTVRFTEEEGRRYHNVYIKALPSDTDATVTVNGQVMQEAEVSVNGTPTFESPVTILVVVTAADTATTKTYTLTTATGPRPEPEQQAQVELPGPVVNLQLLAEADSLTVTWEAPESGGAPDRYIVHLKPADGSKGKVKRPRAEKTSVTFNKLESGATYEVRVRAENEAGKGERATSSITLPEDTPEEQEQQQQQQAKTFSVSATASAAEGSDATLTVTLSEAAPSDGVAFTVTAGYDGSSTATANDVGSITSPVTVTEGNSTLDISIPTADDAVDENDETFTVTVAAATTGWDKADDGRDTATVTITDDDTAGVTVTPGTLSIDEDGSATYTVVLDSKPTADVTVTPTGGDDGAASFAPASYTFTPSDWNTPKTFTVSGVADDDRDDESVTIRHDVTGSDAKYDGIAADSVAVSVADTTPPPAQEPASCPVETEPPVPGQQEPYNVCVTPGDGTLTITWTVSPREGIDNDSIKHALRWSQQPGVWANPPGPLGFRNDGIVIEGGVATYTITGLQNGVATGVFVRSFVDGSSSERSPHSSDWVRIKGENTTPRE